MIMSDISREEYISVLQNELEVLQTYYNPHTEGTGHFNTAMSVLKFRIEQLQKEVDNESNT